VGDEGFEPPTLWV